MLNVRSVACLANALGLSIEALGRTKGSVNECFRELVLIDPAKPDRPRPVLDIYGSWRDFLERLYLRLLLKRLAPSPYSHGGMKGRSIMSNALEHRDSVSVLKTDISNFYPAIHHSKIYELFVDRFGCSPDVASICTRLCTHRHHLALGLTTSPILADQIMRLVDERIGAACRKVRVVYTRFVDDITLSGPFNFADSGFGDLIGEILVQNGFKSNPIKSESGRLSDGIPITSLRITRGKLDVRRAYCDELDRQISDANALACKPESFVGPYYTPNQIRGRVQFVSSINPGRKDALMRQYHRVDWPKVYDNAAALGLVSTRKTVMTQSRFSKMRGDRSGDASA